MAQDIPTSQSMPPDTPQDRPGDASLVPNIDAEATSDGSLLSMQLNIGDTLKEIFGAEDAKKESEGGKDDEKDELHHTAYFRVLTLVKNNIPVVLYGDRGTGKSTIISQIADELGLKLYEEARPWYEKNILGYVDDAGKYHPSKFYQAYNKGGIYTLDNIFDLSIGIQRLLCEPYHYNFFSFPNGEERAPHKDFRLILTANSDCCETINYGSNDEKEAFFPNQGIFQDFCFVKVYYSYYLYRELYSPEIEAVCRHLLNYATEIEDYTDTGTMHFAKKLHTLVSSGIDKKLAISLITPKQTEAQRLYFIYFIHRNEYDKCPEYYNGLINKIANSADI